MTDLRKFSKLPDDPAYWASLEEKIVDGLAEPVSARAPWWGPLAVHAWELGGFAVAAAVAALLFVPVPRMSTDSAAVTLLGAPDHDATVVAFIAAPQPPAVGALLIPNVQVRDE